MVSLPCWFIFLLWVDFPTMLELCESCFAFDVFSPFLPILALPRRGDLLRSDPNGEAKNISPLGGKERVASLRSETSYDHNHKG
jgi:hypothetical protein